MSSTRLSAIASHLSASSEKKREGLPAFDDLPSFHDLSGCAWDVWGKDDELGTVNLLTPDVVKAAATEIKTGRTVPLNWPLNFPEKPVFGRKSPEITVIKRTVHATSRDDEIFINTQSGSQWDGLKHCGVNMNGKGVFYQNTPSVELKGGRLMVNPSNIDKESIKYGIHNWSQHGINGRGVLLDLQRHLMQNDGSLPYDPWTSYGFSVDDIKSCAEMQGVSFRRGDILLLRVGFMGRFYASTQEEKEDIHKKDEEFAGVEQSEDMKRFLWYALRNNFALHEDEYEADRNNHFAAVASDQPSFERWPAPEGSRYLHETLLPLWGMPIGEFFDLEMLSKVCEETGRYSFFFTSTPLNVLGGVASPPNAAAYF